MKEIKIKCLDEYSYIKIKSTYEFSKNCCILVSKDMSSEEVNELVNFILGKKDKLAMMILADIVEEYPLAEDVLLEIYNNGDLGCRVAIALRDDLPESIAVLCAKSAEDEVRSHFSSRRSFKKKQGHNSE